MAQDSAANAAAEKSIRPWVSVVLAMSADGKIGDTARSAARFGSAADQQRLEAQIARADATLFGAGTLRAYHTTLAVREAALLTQRQQRGQPPQPTQIVCSATACFDPTWRFFTQPVPRWLLTSAAGARRWRAQTAFDLVWTAPLRQGAFDWPAILAQLRQQGIQRLAVMGGGELVAALLPDDLVDELYLTLCPLLLGGRSAPTLVDGEGRPAAEALSLQLVSAEPVGHEIFVHYRRHRAEKADRFN
ncbi:MAG: RibD family protein [Leptolyngbya sp. SIO4C1]|nr:RibD family protein [Leptolyngbya sp. SIO4C1]